MDWEQGPPSAEEVDEAMAFWAKKHGTSPSQTDAAAPSWGRELVTVMDGLQV